MQPLISIQLFLAALQISIYGSAWKVKDLNCCLPASSYYTLVNNTGLGGAASIRVLNNY